MDLSVVVPTLNARGALEDCLEPLTGSTPGTTEIIVANGPSSDGTSGVVRDRGDVDVLVELAERNPNALRNAGLEVATGEYIALVGDDCVVTDGWYEAIETVLGGGGDVVTGPVGGATEPAEAKTPRSVGRRTIPLFDPNNVAFQSAVVDALDGFDEYYAIGGARDCAHRLASIGYDVTWAASMAVRRSTEAQRAARAGDWGDRYRSLGYRLAKNYGPRPVPLATVLGRMLTDGFGAARGCVTGDDTPTGWAASGRAVLANAATGYGHGLRARYADRSGARNPNGISSGQDRIVQRYDRV
ncbi:MAG: glycosyltransferase [Natrialbaceae archaeon]|nr:glycosyltransferase [Natrialbaceae archaeon]